MTKIIKMLALLATVLLAAPGGAIAQQDEYPQVEPQRPRDQPRGQIQVTNDWRDEVNITMWTHRREQIGDSWTLRSGETAVLAVDGVRILSLIHI